MVEENARAEGLNKKGCGCLDVGHSDADVFHASDHATPIRRAGCDGFPCPQIRLRHGSALPEASDVIMALLKQAATCHQVEQLRSVAFSLAEFSGDPSVFKHYEPLSNC
jgi:hypothetical protein